MCDLKYLCYGDGRESFSLKRYWFSKWSGREFSPAASSEIMTTGSTNGVVENFLQLLSL